MLLRPATRFELVILFPAEAIVISEIRRASAHQAIGPSEGLKFAICDL